MLGSWPRCKPVGNRSCRNLCAMDRKQTVRQDPASRLARPPTRPERHHYPSSAIRQDKQSCSRSMTLCGRGCAGQDRATFLADISATQLQDPSSVTQDRSSNGPGLHVSRRDKRRSTGGGPRRLLTISPRGPECRLQFPPERRPAPQREHTSRRGPPGAQKGPSFDKSAAPTPQYHALIAEAPTRSLDIMQHMPRPNPCSAASPRRPSG